MKKEITRRAAMQAAALGGVSLAAGDKCFAQTMTGKRPTLYRPDVLVVGGGPAGMGAAMGAAMNGADTMLVENHAFFGGVASYSLGMPINQMRPGRKARGDVHELIIGKLLSYGDLAVRIGQHQCWCNVDYLKVVLFDSLDEVGCRYLVHTQAVDTIVQNRRVVGVVIASKEGLAEIRPHAVVACTGDGDVSFFAGATTMKETGNLSPMTLLLEVTNVDMEKARKVRMRPIADAARKKYPLIPKSWGFNQSPSSNSFYINHSGTRDIGQFDGSNSEQMTQAEATSRRQALQMVAAMREFGPDVFKTIELTATGPQVGVRETRRVKGGYVLTEEDSLSGRKFDDVIAWRSGFLDIGHVRMSRMKIHDVPYRAIVPEHIDGLLMAGRCISATHVAASAGKSMGNCVATGHAAGVAAALSAKKKCMPRELKVTDIQDALRKNNVDLDRGGDDQSGLINKG